MVHTRGEALRKAKQPYRKGCNREDPDGVRPSRRSRQHVDGGTEPVEVGREGKKSKRVAKGKEKVTSLDEPLVGMKEDHGGGSTVKVNQPWNSLSMGGNLTAMSAEGIIPGLVSKIGEEVLVSYNFVKGNLWVQKEGGSRITLGREWWAEDPGYRGRAKIPHSVRPWDLLSEQEKAKRKLSLIMEEIELLCVQATDNLIAKLDKELQAWLVLAREEHNKLQSQVNYWKGEIQAMCRLAGRLSGGRIQSFEFNKDVCTETNDLALGTFGENSNACDLAGLLHTIEVGGIEGREEDLMRAFNAWVGKCKERNDRIEERIQTVTETPGLEEGHVTHAGIEDTAKVNMVNEREQPVVADVEFLETEAVKQLAEHRGDHYDYSKGHREQA